MALPGIIFLKSSFEVQSRCRLCKCASEAMYHMLLGCHCSLAVWDAAITLMVGIGRWRGSFLEQAIKSCWRDKRLEAFDVFPLIVRWAFWRRRNEMLIEKGG
jgi:hypothetical protein